MSDQAFVAKATITGAAELKAKLQQLDAAARAQALAQAATAGAQVIRNAASEKAPYRTGNLRRSIHVEVTESTDAKATVEVGTNVEYAAIQEFGGVITAKNGPYLIFPGKDGKLVFVHSVTIPAHPYLRPAFDENQQKVVDDTGRALKALLANLGAE